MEPIKIEEGQREHIRGFIMNKLYMGGYFAKIGKKHHGKHTSTKNLPRGYPLKHRGEFPREVKALRRAGLILVFPSGKEKHVCAVRAPNIIDIGINLANAYRQSVGLPPLNKNFMKAIRGR